MDNCGRPLRVPSNTDDAHKTWCSRHAMILHICLIDLLSEIIVYNNSGASALFMPCNYQVFLHCAIKRNHLVESASPSILEIVMGRSEGGK